MALNSHEARLGYYRPQWYEPIALLSENRAHPSPGPKEETVGQIKEFQKLFLAPGFLSFISVVITGSLVIVFYFAPKYGKKSMLWYISVCSMIGGISVSVTTGLGAAIVQTAMGDNQVWVILLLPLETTYSC